MIFSIFAVDSFSVGFASTVYCVSFREQVQRETRLGVASLVFHSLYFLGVFFGAVGLDRLLYPVSLAAIAHFRTVYELAESPFAAVRTNIHR